MGALINKLHFRYIELSFLEHAFVFVQNSMHRLIWLVPDWVVNLIEVLFLACMTIIGIIDQITLLQLLKIV